uniref:Uncharacterized protein n=1 Tax=Plectus sambesii TaxID=2011161 RepID=A0A914X204_9BILA
MNSAERRTGKGNARRGTVNWARGREGRRCLPSPADRRASVFLVYGRKVKALNVVALQHISRALSPTHRRIVAAVGSPRCNSAVCLLSGHSCVWSLVVTLVVIGRARCRGPRRLTSPRSSQQSGLFVAVCTS